MKPRYRKPRGTTSRNGRSHGGDVLDRMTDEELLDLRVCDLKLRVEGTVLEQRIARLHDELEYKQLNFRPHFWLSDDWFTPDGIPGAAIPFYLAHPRLMRLESRQMLEVEGGTEDSCMKILRHEAGHAIDNAFRLRRRKRWRETFGRASQPYPVHYNPKPYSKNYVLHLDMWYAQSHPVEDFAETFAVWLRPRSRWRSEYKDWPALTKLHFVHGLMADIRQEKAKVKTRRRCEPLRMIRKTLRDHYQQKRTHYGLDHPSFYDRDLRRLFSESPKIKKLPTAASLLRKMRNRLRKSIAHWTGEYQYTIDQVLNEMIERCRELKLRVDRPVEDVERDMLILLTVQTMNYLHGGHHRVVL